MPQRQGKRQGVRTNATIRRNEFERIANRGKFLLEKNNSVPLSLSKSNRWELLNTEENQLPIRKMIPMHMTSNSKVSPFARAFSGGCFEDYDRARQYQLVNGKRNNISLEEQETIDTWIDVPFNDHEYPLKRQLHRKHETPCKGCLARGGVIVFRGRGKKSSGKTKGMKSYRRKDWEDEFNI
ncbi:hypothetical protein I4U23_013649 [Adineta vaga]|nr:hypothetical protein I4U23_013649 [Adineta vaga]